METKFNKGEWSVGKGSCVVSTTEDAITIGGATGKGAIYYYGGNLICESVSSENAKLIAAAPTMFEALCEIAEGKGRYDEDRLRHAANCIEDMVALAKEAIKKVTE